MKLKPYLALIVFTLFYLINGVTYGQQHTIEGKFTGDFIIDEVSLLQYGLKSQTIATIQVTNNTFSLSIPKDATLGIYKFNYKAGQSQSGFDLIVNNKEDIKFSIILSPTGFIPPVFSKSEVNTQWLIEQNSAMAINKKIQVLQQAWIAYPDRKDKIVPTLEKKILKLNGAQSDQINRLNKTYPFVATVLRNIQPNRLINPSISVDKQDSLFIAQYWDHINTNDLSLLNTPIFNDLIFRYIDYYLQKDKQLPKHEKDARLKQCVDHILSSFTQEDTKAFAINYLTMGFKQIGNEDVLQYIDETYSNTEQCDNPNALNERLEGYKKLKSGNKAPAIIESGKDILAHNSDQQTVLIFWASWCPHCMEEIPQLYAHLKDKNIRIVAVSLDTDSKAYNPIKEKLSDMVHYCDFKKWDSKPVEDYYIKGTPTYFLLDKNNTIVKKYTSFKTLKDSL